MSSSNFQVLLAGRPIGEPKNEHFKFVETKVPEPKPNEMLLRTIYLSLDPYMRGRMNPGPSYAAPVEIGAVMEGQCVCEVVSSNLPNFKTGDIVVASAGWQKYAISNGEGVQKIDPSIHPTSYALGVLGMPGLTAYTGLLNIGKPKPGETLVVAAASGAVGSVVGQIASIKGCRVIGIAGGIEKCTFVKENLGFDECLDHYHPDFENRLKEACANGIDIYFENVGGPVFKAVLQLLNQFARIPICGLIAHYNDADLPQGKDHLPLFIHSILVKRLSVQGFIVSDFSNQYSEFLHEMMHWIEEGKVRYREDITEGLEHAPRELIGLLKGENFGKKIIKVSEDPIGN